MPQMLIYSHFANAQCLRDFPIPHPVGESHSDHPAALFRKTLLNRLVDKFQGFFIWPGFIFRFLLLKGVEFVKTLSGGTGADMLQACISYAVLQISRCDQAGRFGQ